MVVGLTGGIGSGKTSVAKLLEAKSYPVYYSDDRAKDLMNNSDQIKNKILKFFGNESYNEQGLNRPYISSIVFKDKNKLALLNSIVHPVVAKDFVDWKNNQNSDFVFKEAAILFESGAYKNCDLNINISADIEQRIKRVQDRDSVNREAVLSRINNQWSDDKRMEYSDYVMINDNFDQLERKVEELLDFLKSKKEA